MIVSIHQPHFFPWLNYFNKIANSDVFVILDDVQFRRRYFQNRAKIKVADKEQWITVPLEKHSRSTLIKDMGIIQDKSYQNISKTIENVYKRAPHFDAYFQEIDKVLSKDCDNLNDLNIAILKLLLKILNLDVPIYKSSELGIHADEPNERLLKICLHFNATKYIAGKGGKNYMEKSMFSDKGIEILWQDYPNNQFTYEQLGNNFIPGLSVIDLLFNIGAEETKKFIESGWRS